MALGPAADAQFWLLHLPEYNGPRVSLREWCVAWITVLRHKGLHATAEDTWQAVRRQLLPRPEGRDCRWLVRAMYRDHAPRYATVRQRARPRHDAPLSVSVGDLDAESVREFDRLVLAALKLQHAKVEPEPQRKIGT